MLVYQDRSLENTVVQLVGAIIIGANALARLRVINAIIFIADCFGWVGDNSLVIGAMIYGTRGCGISTRLVPYIFKTPTVPARL